MIFACPKRKAVSSPLYLLQLLPPIHLPQASQTFSLGCPMHVRRTKGCNSKNGTGRHGPSIQSGLTKLYHFLYVGDTLADYTCTKFEALNLHEARETDGGAKNLKSVLGVPYKLPF
jgi:hypothetical protein